MTLKQLLGLEGCNISDAQIIRQIINAKSQNLSVSEFVFLEKKVSIHLSQVESAGITGRYR